VRGERLQWKWIERKEEGDVKKRLGVKRKTTRNIKINCRELTDAVNLQKASRIKMESRTAIHKHKICVNQTPRFLTLDICRQS